MRFFVRLLAGAMALAVGLSVAACGPKQDAIVSIGGDKQLSADQIDADPLALLPGGLIALAKVDAHAVAGSSLGPTALRAWNKVATNVADTQFDPSRDLTNVYVAFYSSSGADAAGIAQGTFQPAAIESAVEKGTVTIQGKPLTKVRYANNTMYVAGDFGFSLLTAKTVLIGNMAGMRRALDRIRDGRVKREIPDALVDFTNTPNASMAFAADTTGQTVANTVGKQVPFAQGLKTVRLAGNFAAPGVNVVGVLGYPDAATAAVADGQVKQISSLAATANMLAFLGVGTPIQTLKSEAKDADVNVSVALDGAALAKMLDRVIQ